MLRQLSQFDFHHVLDAQPGVALVMFTGPECGTCRHMRQVIGLVKRRRPAWAFFEIDAQSDPGLASAFDVFHLPTLFLFSDGVFHCELRTQATPDSLETTVIQSLASPAEEEP